MRDVKKPCANCHHEHNWGILRHSHDGAPLYGPRKCECDCDQFVPQLDEIENLPATMTAAEARQLWEKTSFLSAQVPAATRIAVAQLDTLKGPEREKAYMGLMISQLTDIRGAMVRDESKFANLVSHTDEVVESMKGVTQLNDRLSHLWEANRQANERVSKLETLMSAIAEKLGVEVKEPEHPDPEMELAGEPMPLPNGAVKDEVIVVDVEPGDAE